jgi:hypothetical protein
MMPVSAGLVAHWRSLYENRYLGAWNLYTRGRYVTANVIIERAVQEQTVMEGGRKSLSLLLYFAGKRTPMIVTKKMGKVIAAMYGPSPAEWIGKPITLYVEQGFPTRDGPSDVLRVRNDKAGASLTKQLRGQQREDDESPAADPPALEAFDDDGEP